MMCIFSPMWTKKLLILEMQRITSLNLTKYSRKITSSLKKKLTNLKKKLKNLEIRKTNVIET